MRGKKRPADERARAVGIAVVAGGAEASRQTGIPETTIYDWMGSPEFAELRDRTKDQVAGEWWSGVQHGFRVVINELGGDAPLRDKAIATAVLFDKLALMRGEATARTESRSLTDVYNDEEKRKLREFIDTLTADPSEPAGPGGDPAGVGSEVR